MMQKVSTTYLNEQFVYNHGQKSWDSLYFSCISYKTIMFVTQVPLPQDNVVTRAAAYIPVKGGEGSKC